MLYGCSVIHSADYVELLFTKFRKLCLEARKFIPFVQSLQACVVSSSIAYLFPTLEVKRSPNRYDPQFRWITHRLPTKRDALVKIAIYLAMTMTGRVPLPT
ncbi:unnamed protein product [Clonostachys chloroleuca]|uniref:Uncharacterized protein n=1 Tax=Clonostachys chloroleuca TaxID=1926264 RepID=A0AA35MA29_9HYPO|nr:unnamed protein product [Clonostachys chloroleuca]